MIETLKVAPAKSFSLPTPEESWSLGVVASIIIGLRIECLEKSSESIVLVAI